MFSPFPFIEEKLVPLHELKKKCMEDLMLSCQSSISPKTIKEEFLHLTGILFFICISLFHFVSISVKKFIFGRHYFNGRLFFYSNGTLKYEKL